MQSVAIKKYNTKSSIHPLKFALWISLASVTMFFGGFMSAYIVRQAAGNWLEFELPLHFAISTVVIICSSIAIHRCLLAFRQEKEKEYKGLLILSFILGLVFVILQYYGWLALQSQGIDLKGNPSGSFVYIISGVHVAHVFAGLAVMVVAMIHAFTLPFKVTKKRVVRLELTTQYWHYVDLLWVVLYLFLTLYR